MWPKESSHRAPRLGAGKLISSFSGGTAFLQKARAVSEVADHAWHCGASSPALPGSVKQWLLATWDLRRRRGLSSASGPLQGCWPLSPSMMPCGFSSSCLGQWKQQVPTYHSLPSCQYRNAWGVGGLGANPAPQFLHPRLGSGSDAMSPARLQQPLQPALLVPLSHWSSGLSRRRRSWSLG